MDPLTLIHLVVASCVLLLAHGIRAWRWSLLFPPGYLRGRSDLLLGLSFGYAINAVVPMRLGELVRAGFVSARSGCRLPFVAATVGAERMTDAVFLALALGTICVLSGGDLLWGALAHLTLAISAVTVAVAVRVSPRARRGVWRLASVFNDRLRLAILDLAWSYADVVLGRDIRRPAFLAATAAMWCAYAASYALFAQASGVDVLDMVAFLHSNPAMPMVARPEMGGPDAPLTVVPFLLAPVLGMALYGVARLRRPIGDALARLARGAGTAVASPRDRYRLDGEYACFLGALFGGGNTGVSSFGLVAVEDGTVQRFFRGGSGAVTALVEASERLIIRKFAVHDAGEKLRIQADWLESHRDEGLPLAEVTARRQGKEFFCYDMPCVLPSSDFYDVIHTSPVAASWRVLSEVVDRVAVFHGRAGGVASPCAVDGYLRAKATANAAEILAFARQHLPGDAYAINGEAHNLAEWDVLLDPAWLSAQVTDLRTGAIHGDLTVENVVVAPSVGTGWFLIDPNPGNVFDSPLIDWAKLMQSLHLGYEGLCRGPGAALSGADVTVSLTRSQAYGELHARLEGLLTERLGERGLREVHFHELVNYLRLTPYKIRQSPEKGLLFFACTSLLLRRYCEPPATRGARG